MTLAFYKQQLLALWEGSLCVHSGGGGAAFGGTDDRQALEALLRRGTWGRGVVPLLCCRQILGKSAGFQEAKA